jgi:hypothetical protein
MRGWPYPSQRGGGALANATAAFLTSTGRDISLLSLAARDSGSDKMPKKYVPLGRYPSFK